MKHTILYLFFLTSSPSVYAYLDPGTGSLIIQGALAGIAMAAMTIKLYWYRLVAIFNSIFRKNKEKSELKDDDI